MAHKVLDLPWYFRMYENNKDEYYYSDGLSDICLQFPPLEWLCH